MFFYLITNSFVNYDIERRYVQRDCGEEYYDRRSHDHSDTVLSRKCSEVKPI